MGEFDAVGDDRPVETEQMPSPAPVRTSKRTITMSISMVATALLLSSMAFLPTTYVVRGPGPTFDTLGEIDGHPLITISGADTHETTGELRLTTVSASGAPDQPVPLGRVLKAWFDPNSAVYPIESVFPAGETQEQIDAVNQQDMISSQETATVAALTELGYEVPAVMTVAGTVKGSNAGGIVQTGDVVVALNGVQMVTYQQLVGALTKLEPGTVVDLEVERDGESRTLEVETTAGDDEGSDSGSDDGAYLGVLLTTDFDMPVEVDLEIGNVGGASAGMMFALAIIDQLTAEDEAASNVIAGTGTMSIDGKVGPIGGIQFKLQGASRDGAEWFLAPEDNCDEVIGNIPDGLSVFSVGTLEEGLSAVTAIGAGETADLPVCQ